MDGARFRLSLQLDAGCDSHASQTGDQRGSGRVGSRGNERRVRPQSADSPRGLRHGAADRLRQCCEPAAGPRSVAPRTNCPPSRGGSQQAANHRAGPDGGDPPGGRGGNCRSRRRCRGRTSAACFGLSRFTFHPHQHPAFPDCPGVRFCSRPGDRHHFWSGSGLVCHPNQSARSLTRCGPEHG